jgi:hypothetical protein
MRRAFAALAVALLTFFTAPARAADIDPAVVGTWERTIPTSFGPAKSIWSIRADGTYTMRAEGAGTSQHSGRVTFDAGLWSLQATTGGGPFGPPRDQGSYRLDGPDTIDAIGVLGNQSWQRAGTVRVVRPPTPLPPVAIRYTQVGAQRVPANLRDLLADANVRAQAWHAEAVLTSIRSRATADDTSLLNLEFDYFAPSDSTGMTVAAALPIDAPVKELGKVQTPQGRLPPQFPDLIQAFEAARGEGLRSVTGAKLYAISVKDGGRVIVWEFLDDSSGTARTFFVDGFTGAALKGSPAQNSSDAMWAANAASFDRLANSQLRAVRPRPAGWIPPFGITCNTGASCKAVQDRDFDAGRRIDAGLLSATDRAKYDP